MGWSCSTQAHSTLNIIKTLCISNSGFQNVWKSNGREFMFETSRKEHLDGRITGTICELIRDETKQVSTCKKLGRFEISSNGRIHSFRHCPLVHRNWKQRYEYLRDKIFGKDPFVEREQTEDQKEYDLYLTEVLNLIQLGQWNTFGLNNAKAFSYV